MAEVATQQFLVLIQALRQEGFDPAGLPCELRLDSAEAMKARPWRPDGEIDALMQACCEVSGDAGFGLAVASSYAQMSHGTIAMLALHAPTLRTTLDDLSHFHRLIQDHNELAYSVAANVCTIRFSPLGRTPAARRFRAEQIMGGLLLLIRVYGLADEDLLNVHFEHDRPAYADRYADLFGPAHAFGHSEYSLVFRASILDHRRVESDPVAYSIARAAAAAELSAAADRTSVVEAVRKSIRELGYRRAGIDRVASSLGVGERTLRRQLTRDGVSFQEIYDGMRLQESKKLILLSGLPLKQIAERVGFESVGNFHRAFKRLTGATPAQWREANAADQAGEPANAGEAAAPHAFT